MKEKTEGQRGKKLPGEEYEELMQSRRGKAFQSEGEKEGGQERATGCMGILSHKAFMSDQS